MSTLLRSSRRPADVLHAASNDVCTSQHPDFVESSDEQRSSPLRVGAARDSGRPNNWQDCYTWPDNSTDRTIKKTVRLECYDKWARHHDPKNLKEKSKANNITDLSLMPPLLDLHSKLPAFIKQHLPEKKSTISDPAARTIDDYGNHCDPAELLQAVQPVSKSVKEDAAQSSSCIWTTLSDFLPQSKASLDQMNSCEIVAQVMNIRDKLLGASSFRVTLGKQPDSEMRRLQQDYLDAIVEILQRQESCYVIALKRAIAAGKDIHSPPNAAELVSPKSDSKSEERTELDVSESSSDELENPTEFASRGPEIPLNNQRPMIEDHLGHYSDSDLEELQQKLKRLNERTLTDCMVLPRESAYASSNLSPRSPLLNDSSVCDQNFQYDNVLSVGQDASGLMPVNAFTENRSPRPTLRSQSYGRTKRHPSTDIKNKRDCRHTCEYQRCHFDNADNFMMDCTVEDQEDKIIQNDANEDIIEDLSQLMKKRQELESYLAERSDQLKELQEQHDLLKELVEQKEKEQEQADAVLQKMNDVCPTFGGKIGQLLTKSDHLPSKKIDDSCVRESKGNIHEGATVQSQMTSNYGSSSRQKSSHNSSFRIKEKDKDAVINDKENVRSSIKHDCNRRVRSYRGSSNPWVEAPSGNSMPGSPELFADCTKSKDAGELNCDDEDDDNAGRLPSDTECKYLHKKSKQFETDEESASGTDGDDGPNSSLALRDELQHSQNKSKEDYLSDCDYADDSISNPEQLTKSLQNEDTLVKLQFNMSKLVEARKEIEELRNLLHDQAHQAPTPKAIKTSRASGPGENKSRKPMQEVKPPGTAVTFDTQETDHKLLQKLRLLKIANEKLDRLKLVMDEVQRYSNFSPPSNSAISPSTFEDRISTAKASNTSRASNLTSRLTQISELTAMTTTVATERMQSEQSMDATEKSSLHVNSKSLASSGKNNCQPAVKNTVFIRNSLPESVSSLVTSHPRSGSHGGTAGLTSGAMKEKVKIPSKNSSATNISKVSCLPCVSKSADRLPNDVCQQNSASTSQRVEKNSKKPFKATKNQYVESSSVADQSLSSMFQRRRCGNDVDAVPFSKKDSNTKKKRLAINTGKMQQNEVHEKRQMKAELKNIRHELKLLRQEVGSLTQSVDFYILSSGQKLEGHRGDVLDPKLLVGLNQSFQRLLVDNQQLSERFSQLRDFVVKHSCEKSTDNAFHMHRQDKGFGFACDKHMKYQVANEAVCSSDETWVKEAINPLTIKDIHHGKSEDRHPARILAYMENDVTSQGGRPQRMNLNTSVSDNVKDCYGINRNRNNSKAISVGINPAMTFHDAGKRKSLKEINRCDMDMKSLAPNTISENDSSIEHNRFDSLSEKIYSEVAMLISKHENRPHYLLELIVLLQKLKTSTLRQQTVDAFNEIISDYLTDDQLSVPMPFNVEAEKSPQLLSDDMLPYKYSAYYGGDAFEPEMESCATGGNRENDLLNEENEIENEAGCGRVDFCTGHTEYGTSGCLDNLQATVDSNENDDDNSMEESSDGRFIGSEKVEDNWPVIEGDLDVGSEDDDVLYPPDFKSTSSSNLEEDVKNVNAGESEISAMECQDLNTVAEQMGFITVEFANSSSLTLNANSENEKGSFGSNESWEETEISERDADHHNGSDSSEIIEEIIVEDDSSESVEETRIVDQPYAILTSISKDKIARQMAAEYQGELSTQLILETVQPDTLNELAGDASVAKQPVSSTCDESKSRNF